MATRKKTIDEKPFDRWRTPPRQNVIAMPFLWMWAWFATRGCSLKIEKENMQGLKPPFLVLGTHHSFLDFYVTPLALFPHCANYVSELEGFEAYGEWKYRQIGCLGTRKFVNDLALVQNIKKVMERKGILVMYPEARYANAGTSSKLPPSVGKLCKHLGVPVVIINMKGNYLKSPIWNLRKRRGVKLCTKIFKLLSPEDIAGMTAAEIQKSVQNALTYDEYQWQIESGSEIDEPWRAEGLHNVLYQCLDCGSQLSMESKGKTLFCTSCGASWEMDTLGRLHRGGESIHIPDWYEWQRHQVNEEIDSKRYILNAAVHVEALPNAVNFIELGDGQLTHDESGFTIELQSETLKFPSSTCFSIHTEYDYRGKGQCITLSMFENSWFIFPKDAEHDGFNVTKIQFATEYFWEKSHNK